MSSGLVQPVLSAPHRGHLAAEGSKFDVGSQPGSSSERLVTCGHPLQGPQEAKHFCAGLSTCCKPVCLSSDGASLMATVPEHQARRRRAVLCNFRMTSRLHNTALRVAHSCDASPWDTWPLLASSLVQLRSAFFEGLTTH